MDAFLGKLSHSLGNLEFTLEQSAESGRLFSPMEALKESGFANHFICSENQSAYDLAKDCVLNLQEDLSAIGAIIYSTCIPKNANCGDESKFEESRDVKHLMDFAGSHLQSEFGMDKAFVMGITQQACTGMLGTLRVAKMLLADDPNIRSILCVTADRFPKGAAYEQAFNLISDGAAAAIVKRESGNFKIICCHGITNGGLAQASDEEAAGTYFVYCNKMIKEALAKANLNIEQIDWFVPQNMNIKAWLILSRLLKIDEGKTFADSRSNVAHVISGDNIINLELLEASGQTKPGQKLMLVMAGYGMNWQAVILEKC